MSRLDMTLGEVREFLGGGELRGDADFRCESVAPLELAGADQLSFVKDSRFAERAAASSAGALLVAEPIAGSSAHQLVVPHPFLAFGLLLQHIAVAKRAQPAGVDPRAHVDPSAELGEGVTVGPGAVIREEVRIGDRTVIYANAYVGQRSTLGADVILHPNVVVMEDVQLGDRVVVHGGTVIGADGYGYLQQEGRHLKVPQVGSVVIGDDVEIGALATIDRATVDRTVIGRGTKIGDLCHVAHNCDIGEDVLLLPTVTISGSVTVGDGAVFAGRAGCADNLTIGEGAILGGTSVAYKDVPPKARMWGNPARDKGQQMRIQAALGKLPALVRDLQAIKRKLDL